MIGYEPTVDGFLSPLAPVFAQSSKAKIIARFYIDKSVHSVGPQQVIATAES